jgi:hypothetical protein
MRCRKIRKLLEPFMDGELPWQLQEEVTAHLKTCSTCRARLESMQKVEAFSRQLVQTEPDQVYWSTFLPRLRSKIARVEREPRWKKIPKTFGKLLAPPVPWPRLAGAVAVALLVVILGRALIRHEIRMGRIRALPKKLLTEQVQIVTKDIPPKKEVEPETPGARGGRMGISEDQVPVPTTPASQEVPKSAGEMPKPEKKAQPALVSPTPGEDGFSGTDQTSQLGEQTPTDKRRIPPAPAQVDEETPIIEGQELLALDRNEEREKLLGIVTRGGRVSGPDHWRQQIQIRQNYIKAHPRGEELEQAYFRLAEGWYQLTLMTARREDLLQAVEAQRAALDFVAEEATRRLLSSRIQALEERLGKK